VFHIGKKNGREKYNILTTPSSLVCQDDISAQQTRGEAELVFEGKAGWLVYGMTCVALIRDIDIDVVLKINTDIEYFIRYIKVGAHPF